MESGLSGEALPSAPYQDHFKAYGRFTETGNKGLRAGCGFVGTVRLG